MPVQSKAEDAATEPQENAAETPTRTVVGWQGIRCILPPDWNVTGLSLERDTGYLRVDAPANSAMTVQIRWSNVAKSARGATNLYDFLTPRIRRWRKIPDPPVLKPDLKANLEKMLKETAKQAKKGKAAFESSQKTERVEGEHGERSAIHFNWQGAGRGQGKIWYCATCHRIVVAQVVGLNKDAAGMNAVASQLFATLHDHPEDGFDLWALYDLQVGIPEDFRLEAQRLLSGHLHLEFGRGAERILLDRWGLANVALKKFTLAEWLHNHAPVNLARMERSEVETERGHTALRYTGSLPALARVRALKEGRGSLRRFPTRYTGGIWECAQTNKIFAIQIQHNRRTEGLWEQVVERCDCH